MKKTFVKIPELQIVDYKKPICFLGSCFSESISQKANNQGFNVESNPLGVVFNPISLAEFLLHMKSESRVASVVQRNDIYFSWEANSSIFGYSKDELLTKVESSRVFFEKTLSKSSTLFITFGTAWVYELKEEGRIVANCHKFEQKLFSKRLLDTNEIITRWKEVIRLLNEEYPDLHIVFTLSPVRHIKDGLIENARSKAVLLESIHQIVNDSNNCHYFPAYEFILDELRDYGYFSKDGIHPNEIAINEVWTKFFDSMLSPESQKIAIEWGEIRKLFDHSIQYDKSIEAMKFEKHRTQKLEAFKLKYPNLKLDY
jgi:hypothetical protein